LIFAELGIDYAALMASAPRVIGRLDRGKVLFRAPHGDLVTRKISWPRPENPRLTEVIFELRANGSQDVLPPSVHPDTGNPYTWGGPDIANGLPEMPPQLLALWENWDKLRPQLQDICPHKAAREFTPKRKVRVTAPATSVIDAFNDANDMDELLQRFGYKPTARNRYLSPNSSSGLAGVVLFDDGKAYSHHASDPFDSAHTFDAFDLWCHYEHGGNLAKAVKDAAEYLNITRSPDLVYDAEAIAHGAKVALAILPSRQNRGGPLSGIPAHLLTIPGILGLAVEYANETAFKPQPQFAVQAALALASTAMGRRWVTDQRNMTSLYFVNVGLSASGKEHAKTVIERILEAAGQGKLIGPSGYTSASGVFSALKSRPVHIAVIDEFGRFLESAKATGNQHKVDAQTALMEVFGRQTSTLYQQGFSQNGLTKDQKADLEKAVRHPSLTMLAMTTPSTLYENLSSHFVTSGFLNRFIIVESLIGRVVSRYVSDTAPPVLLLEWVVNCATAKSGDIASDSAETPPPPSLVPFAPACIPMLTAYEAVLLGLMDQYDRSGMSAMFGRTKEIAQRLALIVAVSKMEMEISPDSLQWAMDYAHFYALRTVAALGKTMSDGPFEAVCKTVLDKISSSGLKGMTERDLARAVRPFANLEPRKRREVMEALAADHGIACRQTPATAKGGRPAMVWISPDIH